jgi:two-component system NarL family sensor kinase
LSEAAGDARLLERLRAERDERRRLAELVHDGPVQHLAALGQILDAAEAAFGDGDAEAARDLVVRAREIAREAAGDLRDLIASFEPETLHVDGFAAAVRDLTDRVGSRRGITVDVDLPAAELLGEGARSGLYQIVREALDQAVRRGPPSRISVSLQQTPVGGVTLELADDGAQERRQVVLDALTVRADDLNATFAYERTETATTIRITLPPSAAYI